MNSSNFKIEHRIPDTYILNVETVTQFSEFLYPLKTLLSKRNLGISYLQMNKFLHVQHIIINEWQFRFELYLLVFIFLMNNTCYLSLNSWYLKWDGWVVRIMTILIINWYFVHWFANWSCFVHYFETIIINESNYNCTTFWYTV